MLSLALASIISSAPAIVDGSSSYTVNAEEWQTHHAVNGFVNTGPADPHQIFKIHYRVVNGIVEGFSMPYVEYVHYIQANVTSDGNAMLEIRFPKNYPSANVDGGGEAIFFVNEQEVLPEFGNDDCFYAFAIPFSGSGVVDVVWGDFLTGEPFRGVDVPESCQPETLVQDVVSTQDGVIPPLHQIKAGVKSDEVVCGDNFELVTHPNGKPYCATPSSSEILRERWNL